jgi:hypothetical protein
MSTRESKLEEKIVLLRAALSAERSKTRRLNQENKSLGDKLERKRQKAGRLQTQLSSELKKNENSEWYCT